MPMDKIHGVFIRKGPGGFLSVSIAPCALKYVAVIVVTITVGDSRLLKLLQTFLDF